MTGVSKRLLAMLVLAVAGASAMTMASTGSRSKPEAPVFGPRRYTRTVGQPNEFSETFTLPASVHAPFLLRVVNGDASGKHRVSSASIKLNGKEVLKSSECSDKVSDVERTVDLKSSNTLQITLTGSAGGVLTVSILGTAAPTEPKSIEPNPLALTVGSSGALNVTLAPPPSVAGSLTVENSSRSVVLVPASVAFAAGQTTVRIPVEGKSRGSATISVTLNDVCIRATVNVTGPINKAPVVSAGPDETIVLPASARLVGTVSDDGLPARRELDVEWKKVSGPGKVRFEDRSKASTSAAFSKPGTYVLRLTADDSDLTASDEVTIDVAKEPPPNAAPTSDPGGPYSGTAGSPVAFHGIGTDSDGDPLTFAWEFGDGGKASGSSPSHTYTADGTFTVTLVVDDGRGGSTTATTTATIKAAQAPNSPPHAAAGGPYSAQLGEAIAFSGSASSDADGDPLTYDWTFGDGGTETGVSPSHTYATAGTFTVTLTVSDGRGGSNSASTTATVTTPPPPPPPVNHAPVARIGGPYTGYPGTPVSFDASASSDSDGDSLIYEWRFGDGGTGSGPTPSRSYASTGTFTVEVTVSDGRGGVSTASTTATITSAPPVNQVPVADAGGPYAEFTGSSLVFDGSKSKDPDGDTLSYRWAFGDGSTAASVSPSHSYASAGTFAVTLTVEDGRGGSHASVTSAVIESRPVNRPPSANPGGPYHAEPNVLIGFDGRLSSDPDGDALTYAWTFGDGDDDSGGLAKHAYSQAGTYTATLTVSDAHGGSSSATASVRIDPASDRAPPVISLEGPREALPGAQVTLTAQVTDNVKVESVRFDVAGASTTDVSAPPFSRTIDIPAVASPGDSVLVKATARDPSANTASAEARVMVVATPDSIPPIVVLHAPPRVGRGATLRVSATVTDTGGVDKVTFTIDGQPTVVASGQPLVATFDVAADRAVGTAIPVLVRGVDFAGNAAQAEASVLVVVDTDTTPPTVTLSAPSEIGIGSMLTMTATAADDTGVAAVEFLVGGTSVHTATAAPFTAQYPVPSSFVPGTILQLRAIARDFSALEASADATTIVTTTESATRSVVTGEAYDDTTGLLLPGVTIAVSGTGSDGVPFSSVAVSDERGRFAIPAGAGHVVVVMSKEGYTRSWRQGLLTADQATEVFDGRLTPIGGATSPVSPVLGGKVARDGIELELAAGALTSATDLRLTWIGQQGLIALLPAGWSPAAAVDIAPRATSFVGPQVLRAPNRLGIAAGVATTLARFDEVSELWRAIGTGTALQDGSLPSASVEGGGQYAWLVADTAPAAPPQPSIGQPLMAAGPATVPADATAVINPQPRIIFYKPGVFSDVGTRAAGSGVLQSGAHVLAHITESYRYFAGTEQHPEPFTEDLVLFQAADASAIQSTHRVTPSLTFEPLALELGVITVEVEPAATDDPTTPVIGEDGGTVSAPGGEQLRVPPGAGAGGSVFGVQRLTLTELGAGLPQGLNFVGAAAVSFAGQIARAATLSIPRPAGLVDASRVLLARLQPIAGEDRFVLVGAARLVGDRLESDIALGDNPQAFEGIRIAGRYVFVRPAAAFGFVTGRVLGLDQATFTGALVTTPTLSLVALSSGAGYLAAGAVGTVPLTATDIVRSDSGSGQRTLAAARVVETLDLTLTALAPTVLSVTPAEGAQNVPLGSPVVARFSRPINPASAFGDAVRLTGPNGAVLPGAVVWSLNGTTLTFRPAAALEPNLDYVFRLGTQLSDITGRALAAAVVTHFGSLDTNPPPKPPAGSITASIPENGTSKVRATQGTIGRSDTASILNLSRKVWTPVLVDPDGGFLTLVEATVSERLRVRIVDPAGNEVFVDLPRFSQTNADGSVSSFVGNEGGKVDGPSGVAVDVPDGAFPNGVTMTLRHIDEAHFPIQLNDADREILSYTGGIEIDLGGVQPQIYLNLSLPARPTDGPEDQWIVGQIIEAGGRTLFNTVDRARVIAGRIATSSPPCPGAMAQAKYGFVKSNGPVGLDYAKVATRSRGIAGAIFAQWLGLRQVSTLSPGFGGGGLQGAMVAANILGMTNTSTTFGMDVCLPVLTGRASVVPNSVNISIDTIEITALDRHLVVRNGRTGQSRTIPLQSADLSTSFKTLNPDFYSAELLSRRGPNQDLGSTAGMSALDSSAAALFTVSKGDETTTVTVNPDIVTVDPVGLVVRQVFKRWGGAGEDLGPGVAFVIPGSTSDAYEVEWYRWASGGGIVPRNLVTVVQALGSGPGKVEVQIRPAPGQVFERGTLEFYISNVTTKKLSREQPFELVEEGATSDPIVVEAVDFNGTSRPLRISVTPSAFGPKPLVLKVLPATIDPVKPVPGTPEPWRTAVRLVRQVGNSWVTLAEISEAAIVEGGIQGFGFDGIETDHYGLAIDYGTPVVKTETVSIPTMTIGFRNLDTGEVYKTIQRPTPYRDEPVYLGRLSDDTEAPSLETTNDDLTLLDPSDGFLLRFSEGMDLASLRNGIRVLDSRGRIVDGEVRVTDGNRIATFFPFSGLRLGERYTVELNVRDASGNLLPAAQALRRASVFKPTMVASLSDVTTVEGSSPMQLVRDVDLVRTTTAGGDTYTLFGVTRGAIQVPPDEAKAREYPFRVFAVDMTNPAVPVERGRAGTDSFGGSSNWRLRTATSIVEPLYRPKAPPPGWPENLPTSFDGNLALVTRFITGISSLQFYDITNPAAPTLLADKYLTADPSVNLVASSRSGAYATAGYAKGLATLKSDQGLIAYVAIAELGLAAVPFARHAPTPPPLEREQVKLLSGNYVEVVALRSRLYALNRDTATLDAVSPNLALLGSTPLGQPGNSLVAIPAYGFDYNKNGAIEASELRDLVVVGGDEWIQIVDVTEGAAPSVIGSIGSHEHRVQAFIQAPLDFHKPRGWLVASILSNHVSEAEIIDIGDPRRSGFIDDDGDDVDDRVVWRDPVSTTDGLTVQAARFDPRGYLYISRALPFTSDYRGRLEVWDIGGAPRVKYVRATVSVSTGAQEPDPIVVHGPAAAELPQVEIVSGDLVVVRPGTPVVLSARSADTGCKTVTYKWSVQGSVLVGQTVVHTYTAEAIYLPEVTALCDQSTSGPSDHAKVVVTDQLRIDKVWAGQFTDSEANSLPGGAGVTGNRDNYILMGLHEGRVVAKARLWYPPDMSGNVVVGLRRVTAGVVGEVEGQSAVDRTEASVTIDAASVNSNEINEYSFVAGLDSNHNHKLDDVEIAIESPYRFQAVGALLRLRNRLYLDGLALLSTALHPTAKNLMNAFLNEMPVTGATRSAVHIDSTSDRRLSHAVGAHFNSEGEASIDRWTFGASSDPALRILRSEDMLFYVGLALGVNIVDDSCATSIGALVDIRRQVRAWKPASDSETFHVGPYPLDCLRFHPLGDESLPVGATLNADRFNLGAAFGRVKPTIQIEGEGKVVSGEVVVTNVRVRGRIEDLYDWDLSLGDELNSAAARVQAGFGTMGTGGKIFEVEVILDGILTESGAGLPIKPASIKLMRDPRPPQ